MPRLISQEVLDKYLVKKRTVNGKEYEVIFEYSQIPVVDTEGDEIAHEVIVGFRDLEEVQRTRLQIDRGKTADYKGTYTGSLFLPISLANGLLTRNKTTWYTVSIVLPPLAFYGGASGKLTSYMNEIIRGNVAASSLEDFLPQPESARIDSLRTPLMKSLMPEHPEDINDINKWNIIGLELALLELFNRKIFEEIARSQRGGYSGISASVKALHTLIRAFCRYNEEDEECGYRINGFEEVPEEMECLGSVKIQDKLNAVLIHDIAKGINIRSDCPIDFCSCSQTLPIRTGRIKTGIQVKDGKFVGKSTFPYAPWRRSIFGILADDPRRVIVSRNISRAMSLHMPDSPLAVTECHTEMNSLSLPGVRMTHPLNYEDGIIVSETFARKAGAYKLHVDRFSVPTSVRVTIRKRLVEGIEYSEYARRIVNSEDQKHYGDNLDIIRRGDVVAIAEYIDMDGQKVVKELKSKIRSTGVVIKIGKFIPATDLEEGVITYRIVSFIYLPLEVGDKVSDAHGNKSTISAIWNDLKMPVWKSPEGWELRAHYIATPYIMKRLALGAEIEDKKALATYVLNELGEDIYAERSDTIWTNEIADEWLKEARVSYTGTVTIGTKIILEVPISLRQMFRLDNNARETVAARSEVVMGDNGRVSRNTKMGIDIVTMLSRGASALVRQLVDRSGSREIMQKTVVPILYAMESTVPVGARTFEITQKLDRRLLGNPIGCDILSEVDFTDTVCDSRIANGKWGIINLGKGKKVVVPPHCNVAELGLGSAAVNRIAVYANRVISERMSRDQGYWETTSVDKQVDRYLNVLANAISSKGGLLRDTLLPVFPTSIRAVASSNMSDNPLEIMLPVREFNYLKKKNPDIAHRYKNRENWFCIVKRDPVHRNQNVIAVRFDVWSHRSIGISPLLIGSMDGERAIA